MRHLDHSGDLQILAFAIGGLGDIVLFLPALRLLRERRPNARITLALTADSPAVHLFRTWPWVDEVCVLPWNRSGLPPPAFLRTLRALRHRGFDASVFAHAVGTWKKEFIAFSVGARQRLQYRGEGLPARAAALLNGSPAAPAGQHVVEMNVGLLARLGVHANGPEDLDVRIPTTAEDRDYAAQRFPRLEARFRIGIHPGGNLAWSRSRTWPLASYASLMRELRSRFAVRFVLFGRPAEAEILRSLQRQCADPTAVEIVMDEPLCRIPALLERMDFFCGNMSSLVLIAGSVRTPTVAVSGPTPEGCTSPRGPFAWVAFLDLACRPCFFNPASHHAARCRNQIPYQCLAELPAAPIADLIAGFLSTPASLRQARQDGATRLLRLQAASPCHLRRDWRTVRPPVAWKPEAAESRDANEVACL